MDGWKDVLGMRVGENESAKYWATVLNGLRNRGVEDIFIACTDNLTGLSAAIEAVFPKTKMTNFPTILARLSGTFGADRADFLASLGDYDLLIIDDLGVERGTEYALEQVFSIIDSRYRSGKPLIVTTNLELDELKHPPDLAHARIYDRILEGE